MNLAFVLVGVASLSHVGLLPAGDSKADLEFLQGNWKVVSVKESDGKNPTDDYVKFLSVQVKGDVMKITAKGEVIVMLKVKLDAGKNPKTIDCLHEGDPADVDKGKTELGIYKFEGDTVTFCTNVPGATDRPTTFAIKEKTNIQLAVFKKVK